MKHKIRAVKRWFKFLYQRWARGFDDSDLWNLDTTISLFIIPRLKAWKETYGDKNPGHYTVEEWKTIVDKMIVAFELSANDIKIMTIEEQAKIDEGLKLFAEHFNGLWD